MIVGDGCLVDIDDGKPLRKRRLQNEVDNNHGLVDIFDDVVENAEKSAKGRRAIKYDDENVDPATAISIIEIFYLFNCRQVLYPDLDNPDDEPVLMSSQITHTAPQMSVHSDGLTVINQKVHFNSFNQIHQ